jgi:diaminopimelate decarboxylase
MHRFEYRNGELFCEEVPLKEIAKRVGTPSYIYSLHTLERHFRAFTDAFSPVPHIICFSVKSNGNIAIMKIFSRLGGGADIVSGGELYRALKAGINPKKIVFSGVGKTEKEMEEALRADILMFNCESPQEVRVLNEVAGRIGRRARIALRINPDIDPKTHPYISTGLKENKFGIDIARAVDEYIYASGLENIDVVGLDCHIGSQLTEVEPFVESLERMLVLMERLKKEGIVLRYLDLGGGLGITYDAEEPPHPSEYAEAIIARTKGLDCTLILEPGRVIVGNAGILLTKVLFTKEVQNKRFIIVDAGMNDLIRPSLYGSFHAIQPVDESKNYGELIEADLVGPICESGDFFAQMRRMPKFERGDLLAIMSAGAYGFSMSSNYNARPRAAEVLVNGDKYYIIRARETYEWLIQGEYIPDFLKC